MSPVGVYLIDRPGTLRQYSTRNLRRITGCTVVHTAESVMDTVGPDTGAEAVAEFIRTRATPGSYHDLVDSDSYVPLVPYEHAAWQDGTGSNPWALSISFACRTVDWRRMTPEKRAGFLRNGARAFAAQQAWRRAHGLPLTELRRITKAQSDRGESGFIAHGDRDPGRRSDPGVRPPDLFPWAEWFDHCLAAVTGKTKPDPDPGDPDMRVLRTPDGTIWLATDTEVTPTGNLGLAGSAAKAWGAPIACTREEVQELINDAEARRVRRVEEVQRAGSGTQVQVTADTLAAALARPEVAEAFAAVMDRRARDGDPATGPVS